MPGRSWHAGAAPPRHTTMSLLPGEHGSAPRSGHDPAIRFGLTAWIMRGVPGADLWRLACAPQNHLGTPNVIINNKSGGTPMDMRRRHFLASAAATAATAATTRLASAADQFARHRDWTGTPPETY